MNAYYLLSRLLSPAVETLFYFYSLVTKTPRARVVVRNEEGEILLFQSWPNTTIWNLPGGGLKQGESGLTAAKRELLEEVGIDVPVETFRFCLAISSLGHKELIYTVTVQKEQLPSVLPNRWEVRSAAWFNEQSLPNVNPLVHRVIAEVADTV